MISVYIDCPACHGAGGFPTTLWWARCAACDGIGRAWAPGAPSYGHETTLADRTPGEVVTLGNGERGRVLWHMPRRTKKVTPETTFLGMIEPFTDLESPLPVPYPSCVGVLSVDVSRTAGDDNAHDRSRSVDLGDPVHRQIAGRLM